MEETPGTPNEPHKPNQNPKKITFRIHDLHFLYSLNVDGYNYLTFIYKDEFLISMRKWEYLELLDRVYSIMENEDNVVVDVIPDYETLQINEKIKGVVFDVENNKTTEIDKEIPHYEVFNLLKNLSANIEDQDFNLN